MFFKFVLQPKKKSFFQERNEGIASSGGVAGRLSLFQNKIDKGGDKPEIRKVIYSCTIKGVLRLLPPN